MLEHKVTKKREKYNNTTKNCSFTLNFLSDSLSYAEMKYLQEQKYLSHWEYYLHK